ncbi:hypothetical protein E2320_002282 [Naja naja]|nr:hypothetical protein E2320_002282 [Naja naja]
MGLGSTYVQGMLEATMRNHILVPEDWKTTFRMLLTPAQYVVWDSEFRHQCAVCAQHLGGGAFTTEQLYGSDGKPKGKCYNCGKPGHYKWECCNSGRGMSTARPPIHQELKIRPKTKCPKCQKGYHWAKECWSGNS